MQIFEVSNNTYYHGSMDYLQPGTVLTPRPNYEDRWGGTDFYTALEKHRPSDKLAHKDAVFMCQNENDVDLAGGGTEYLFTVVPSTTQEKHDMNWSSEISMLISDGHSIDSDVVKNAAKKYWNGEPHHSGESVWEFLTPTATIVDVEEY